MKQLAKIRGAMWTARLDLPWGPRPDKPDNCMCIDYFECFSDTDQDRMLAAYGPSSPRKYTHAPLGPIVDLGYHGQLPACDWRANPGVYFDASRKEQAHGVEPIHFNRPDAGVAGLAWNVDDLDRELTPIFSTPEAQDTMRVVCIGWECGGKYGYNNDWWVEMAKWQARVFPNALRLIHLPVDQDAPTGQDDDRRGFTNAQCWANVAPYLHGALMQYGGYLDLNRNAADYPQQYAQFKANLGAAIADLKRRFRTGGPEGDWPTSSAWGDGQPLDVYLGEDAAYKDYWENAPESESIELGNVAIAAGAAGYLDGGSVDVP